MRNYLFVGLLALSLATISWAGYGWFKASQEISKSKIESVYVAFEIERVYQKGLVQEGSFSKNARVMSRRMAYDCMLYLALHDVKDHNAFAVTSNYVKLDTLYNNIPEGIRRSIDDYLQSQK